MATQKPQPVTHIYREINKGKYTSVCHYELVDVKNGNNQLSEKINLSDNRDSARSKPEMWLKIRLNKKWSPWITGLFPIGAEGFYWGDLENKKHLLVFRLSSGSDLLKVWCYKNYFPFNGMQNPARMTNLIARWMRRKKEGA